MPHLHNLQDVRSGHQSKVGGKAAALGELLAANIPVPTGFVVATAAFYDFLSQNGLTDPTPADIMATPVSPTLVSDIITAHAALGTPFVAVRSSATAEDSASNAWAGQLESYVPTDESNLITNIKKCWASLYGPRAVAYRQQTGLADTQVGVAVIVQQLVDSQFAGIGFSAHPVTGDRDVIVIEAVQGLGEAAVGGHVTPDTFIINKHSGAIVESYPGAQDKKLVRGSTGQAQWQPSQPATLSSTQLQTLCAHIRRIESHFGRPMDIEWALTGDTCYIVQSRPITA